MQTSGQPSQREVAGDFALREMEVQTLPSDVQVWGVVPFHCSTTKLLFLAKDVTTTD